MTTFGKMWILAIVIVVGVGCYFWFWRSSSPSVSVDSSSQEDQDTGIQSDQPTLITVDQSTTVINSLFSQATTIEKGDVSLGLAFQDSTGRAINAKVQYNSREHGLSSESQSGGTMSWRSINDNARRNSRRDAGMSEIEFHEFEN